MSLQIPAKSVPAPITSPTQPQPPLLRRCWSLATTYPLLCATLVLISLALALWLSPWSAYAHWPLIVALALGVGRCAWEVLQQFRHHEFGVDLIAGLAMAGALLLQEYLAGAIIVLMLAGGEALEAFALRRARASLATLAERAPRVAHIRAGATVRDIPADAVEVGMCVVIKPGELIPVDGVVLAGTSDVNEADLTGEPIPIRKTAGSQTMSGSVNLDGVLDVQAIRSAAASHYAQILELMRAAQENKAPIHRLADRYSVLFTAFTLLLAGVAWLASGYSVRALAVLVVATPCPLILATPIAIMSGINAAAKLGVIVKSGAAIEALGSVDVAVFDKTGTLTLGLPQVKAIQPGAGITATTDELLQRVASIEQYSAHVLSQAFVRAAQDRQLTLAGATAVSEDFGKGIRGDVAGDGTGAAPIAVAVGNRTFMRQLGYTIPADLLAAREACVATGEIGSFIAVDDQIVGLAILADLPRPEMASLMPALKAAGVTETVLLTGDSATVAERIGRQAGVDRIVAQCLPEAKVREIATLEQLGHHVLMVGDGVNDAPALATASVGIAVGTQGMTAAASVADGVLLTADLLRLARVVQQGRWVMHVARQGIITGISLSAIAMICAAFGLISPVAGAILQEGIDVIVILNALRATRPHGATGART